MLRFHRMQPDTFINAYCAHRDAVITNRAQAMLLWESMRNFMLEWVLNRGEDLDLGFATLCALPVRRNWMDVRNARNNGGINSRAAGSRARHWRNETECITAFDKANGVIRWDIVAIVSQKFHDAALKVEIERRVNKEFYTTNVREMFERYEPKIDAIFKTYLAETAYPTFRIPEYRARGRTKTDVATKAQNGVDTIDGGGGVLETSGQTDVAIEDAGVSQVFGLPSLTQDVRDTGRDVHCGGAIGTIGLYVPNAIKGEASGELLGVRQAEGPDGHRLAETPELISL